MFYRDLNVLTIFTSYKVLIASCQSHFMISEKFLREIMCTCDIISKYSRHLTCTEKSLHIPPPPQHCRNEKVRFPFFPLESHWVAMSSRSAVDFLVAVFFKLIWHGPFLIISSSSSEHEKWEHTDRQSLSSNRLLQTQIFFARNIFNEELSTDVLRTLVYFPHSLALDITLQNWGFCCQLQAMVKWLQRPVKWRGGEVRATINYFVPSFCSASNKVTSQLLWISPLIVCSVNTRQEL